MFCDPTVSNEREHNANMIILLFSQKQNIKGKNWEQHDKNVCGYNACALHSQLCVHMYLGKTDNNK